MVLVIAWAPEAKVRIAPAEAVITSHFVCMTFSLRVQVASNEWKSGSIDPAVMSTTTRNLSSRTLDIVNARVRRELELPLGVFAGCALRRSRSSADANLSAAQVPPYWRHPCAKVRP